jgi:hypothetical protein
VERLFSKILITSFLSFYPSMQRPAEEVAIEHEVGELGEDFDLAENNQRILDYFNRVEPRPTGFRIPSPFIIIKSITDGRPFTENILYLALNQREALIQDGKLFKDLEVAVQQFVDDRKHTITQCISRNKLMSLTQLNPESRHTVESVDIALAGYCRQQPNNNDIVDVEWICQPIIDNNGQIIDAMFQVELTLANTWQPWDGVLHFYRVSQRWTETRRNALYPLQQRQLAERLVHDFLLLEERIRQLDYQLYSISAIRALQRAVNAQERWVILGENPPREENPILTEDVDELLNISPLFIYPLLPHPRPDVSLQHEMEIRRQTEGVIDLEPGDNN